MSGAAWQEETMPALRSAFAALSLSLNRLARAKYFIAAIMLAILPLGIALIMLVARDPKQMAGIETTHTIYESFLRVLYLHFIVFFSANIFGFAAIRQDVEEQTLHYLLLQPARRWMIMAGRFGAYLTWMTLLCVGSLWLTYLLMGLRWSGSAAVVADLFAHGRFVILIKESTVLTLGLACYGAIAMLMGCFFKSGLYAVLLLMWESGLPYLPSALKYMTVMHYLQSLLPERRGVDQKIFEWLGTPASTPLCLVVLIVLPMILIGITCAVFQVKEALYGE